MRTDEFQLWLNKRHRSMAIEIEALRKRSPIAPAIKDLQEKMYELSTVMAVYKEFKRGNSIQGN